MRQARRRWMSDFGPSTSRSLCCPCGTVQQHCPVWRKQRTLGGNASRHARQGIRLNQWKPGKVNLLPPSRPPSRQAETRPVTEATAARYSREGTDTTTDPVPPYRMMTVDCLRCDSLGRALHHFLPQRRLAEAQPARLRSPQSPSRPTRRHPRGAD